MKESWKPGTMIYPLPAVLVGCGDAPDNWNLLTVAWTGTVCTAPPMCYVSVRPERHSHALIARTGEFTINLTTAAMARAVDWCGVRSGRDYDKFRETGLTPLRGAVVAAPALEESPVVVECRVRQILPLGSHDMFLAEVVNVLTINGHDFDAIESAIAAFRAENEKPTCIILDTLKGKGVSFMENSVDWHGKGPNDEEYAQAMQELNAAYAALEEEDK